METNKYTIVLKLVNGILQNSNKDTINNLEEFKNIDKNDINTDANKKLLESMYKELFGPFDKKKCGYYYRKRVDNPTLKILRSLLKDIGYQLKYKQKEIRTNNTTVSYNIYSIIKVD